MDKNIQTIPYQNTIPYNNAGIKFRRFVAWIIDWNLSGLAIMFLVFVYSLIFLNRIESANLLFALGMFAILLLYPVMFILRDVIFGGRSVGKRIMGLIVLDKKTGQPASKMLKAVRGLSIFILTVDAIVLLICGRSVGDMIANTVVTRKKDLSIDTVGEIPDDVPTRDSNKSKRNVIIVIVALACGFALLVTLILSILFTTLNAQKDTEEYALAYEYLVTSELFDEYGIDENNIKLREYSSHTQYDPHGNKTRDIEYGFSVSFGKRLWVICHEENDVVYVCRECTKFD